MCIWTVVPLYESRRIEETYSFQILAELENTIFLPLPNEPGTCSPFYVDSVTLVCTEFTKGFLSQTQAQIQIVTVLEVKLALPYPLIPVLESLREVIFKPLLYYKPSMN